MESIEEQYICRSILKKRSLCFRKGGCETYSSKILENTLNIYCKPQLLRKVNKCSLYTSLVDRNAELESIVSGKVTMPTFVQTFVGIYSLLKISSFMLETLPCSYRAQTVLDNVLRVHLRAKVGDMVGERIMNL